MENNHRLEKDIILICKGRYNHKKYKSQLEAFKAYYHKYYGCDDIEPNRGFIVNLFFKPTIQYILKKRNNIYNFINYGLFSESCMEKRFLNKDGYTEFYDVLYYRLITWICLLSIKENGEYIDIDFSKYPLDDENWEGVI